MGVERTLKKLQNAVRVGRDDGTRAYYRVLPDDLATEDIVAFILTRSQEEFRHRAIDELLADRRFEHLQKKVEDHVWRFICLAHLEKGRDHVADFVAEHRRPPMQVMCFFPVEHLDVVEPMEVAGALLLPLGDKRIPDSAWFQLAPPEAGVIAVPTEGTNLKFMRDRAWDQAQHALRVLRVGSRAEPFLHPYQLRFRLGARYVFDNRAAGTELPEGAAFQTHLTQNLLKRTLDQSLAAISFEPANDVERHAKLALEWLDRALLATDDLVATLFRFFALEALLGDESEGLKAHGLTFRRTLLGHIVTGHFTEPALIYFLYGEVRSAAVHGGMPPDVPRNEIVSFDYSVRTALNEYLAFAQQAEVTRQSQLLRGLHEHPDAGKVFEWLREQDARLWADFPV
jgi:hypothetical protein